MKLARVLSSRGHQAAAAALVQTVYGAFSEGFDGLDLQEATAFLKPIRPPAL